MAAGFHVHMWQVPSIFSVSVVLFLFYLVMIRASRNEKLLETGTNCVLLHHDLLSFLILQRFVGFFFFVRSFKRFFRRTPEHLHGD